MRLIVEGVKAQSCFVWIVDRGGRLVLRAASSQYADAVGRATLAPGEGFAGWVSEHRQPIFIPSDALADPRARYFPEFEEEKYQSMVSVPLIAKDGAVFGVIGLHSRAPRTLTEDDASFVIHSASLVAGAIENARLYEATRRRVHELERLSEIADRSLARRHAGRAPARPSPRPSATCSRPTMSCVYADERGERLVRRAAAPGRGHGAAVPAAAGGRRAGRGRRARHAAGRRRGGAAGGRRRGARPHRRAAGRRSRSTRASSSCSARSPPRRRSAGGRSS